METFETIRDKKLLLYEFIRGSHCHGTATETSDVDTGGCFIAPLNNLVDLGFNYQAQVANETNDIVWYELKKFMQLLIKSNPTILESLFVDDKYVLYEHPIMTKIKSYRDKFLTKKCFNSFFSYAESQIKKAKGLNKMINWDIPKRKGVLDFTFTFYNQGSTNIQNWLEYRGLKQEYCGLVNIPNMRDVYGVYYDWGNFFLHENIKADDLCDLYFAKDSFPTKNIVEKLKDTKDEKTRESYEAMLKTSYTCNMINFITSFYDLHNELFFDYELQDMTKDELRAWFEKQKPIGYSGMVGEKSEQLRLSSVSKGEKPICYVSFNKDGYTKHCIDYKNYKDWEAHRNPIRYESNLKKSYDAKNMSECFRLMHCGIEVAKGKGYIVDRSGIDADFLLDVKHHKFEYEELIEKLEILNAEMKTAMENSTIPDDIDEDFVNGLYLEIVKDWYGL